jgi:hypothetical protein
MELILVPPANLNIQINHLKSILTMLIDKTKHFLKMISHLEQLQYPRN